MRPSNAGGYWSIEEESQLYEETGRGILIAEIASLHCRTEGAIGARQRRMGLRDEAGELIVPLPPFRPTQKKTSQELVAKKLLSNANTRRRLFAASAEVNEPRGMPCTPTKVIPKHSPALPHDFFRTGDLVDWLWYALRQETLILLKTRKTTDAFATRAADVILSRLTPMRHYQPATKRKELSDKYDVSGQRIRQIEMGLSKLLMTRVRRGDSLLLQVLRAVLDTLPDEWVSSPRTWLASDLARQGCRTPFVEFVLEAYLRSTGLPAEQVGRLTSEAKLPLSTIKREARRPSPSLQDDLPRKVRRANNIVRKVLVNAAWPATLNEKIINLAEVRALRSRDDEHAYYARLMNRYVNYDSNGEKRLIRALDICTIVTEFVEQPINIKYRFNRRERIYIPDFLVRTDADLYFVIEIKARQQLTDQKTLAKAAAATAYLGKRGIGYCLSDAKGFGLRDLRAMKPDEEFCRCLHDFLQRKGTMKRAIFEDIFGCEKSACDQLQSVVLRDQFRYYTSLRPSDSDPKHYDFDFQLYYK